MGLRLRRRNGTKKNTLLLLLSNGRKKPSSFKSIHSSPGELASKQEAGYDTEEEEPFVCCDLVHANNIYAKTLRTCNFTLKTPCELETRPRSPKIINIQLNKAYHQVV